MTDADYWIAHLSLIRHPEGGFYKEVFRSEKQVNRAGSARVLQACTSIYYLLEGDDYSGFHRILSDEIWYFHKGSPLTVHIITADGRHEAHELSDGPDGSLSLVVPAGLWFAAEITQKSGYTLVSCAVAPGFEFSEFEMADKHRLIQSYPGNEELFDRLCRG
ncbi:cupin domain-containing protein [Mucilaginibacter koreensis]